MKISNPKVTLADEARCGVEEEIRSGFLDWLYEFSVQGDDGAEYALGGSILSMHLEKMDLVTMVVTKGFGTVRQLKNSIYKIGEYHAPIVNRFFRNPQGTLTIEKRENSVLVTCGKEFQVECFADNRWHLIVNSHDGDYEADLWHTPHGFPLWYGREKPSYLTQHSVTYGYNWAGDVAGEIVLKGKKIRVSGTGQRERYVAVDSSAAELGGWEDWGYITFHEIHSSMYDMRLGMKDFSVYDLQTKKHYPEGRMEIEHEDWVFVRELDGFMPTVYKIKIEVEDGVYEVKAHTGNIRCWGATKKVPENPVGSITYDRVEGTFTGRDGTVRTLTGGRGAMSVRQWHAYPRILPQELFTDEVQTVSCESKFDTL